MDALVVVLVVVLGAALLYLLISLGVFGSVGRAARHNAGPDGGNDPSANPDRR